MGWKKKGKANPIELAKLAQQEIVRAEILVETKEVIPFVAPKFNFGASYNLKKDLEVFNSLPLERQLDGWIEYFKNLKPDSYWTHKKLEEAFQIDIIPF